MSLKKPQPSRGALLSTLTDSAALPALVEHLEPQVLKQVVDHVGLEDAGALIEYASPAQIAHLLDESIWSSPSAGELEQLNISDLLRWFDLWTNIGRGFAADKLHDLGEAFCALCFAKLISVTQNDLAPPTYDEATQIIGEYVVRSRIDDEWDSVQQVLNDLWETYPHFLEALLASLSFRHSILRIAGEDDSDQVLEADAGHVREQNKEHRGYVTAPMAERFLQVIENTDLDELTAESQFDIDTEQYFLRRTQLRRLQPTPSEGSTQTSTTHTHARSGDAELKALERDLEKYEVFQVRRLELLAAPADESIHQVLPVRRALANIAHDIERFEERSNELIYLANLVMTNNPARQQSRSQEQAANTAMEICNLGGSYLLWLEGQPENDNRAVSEFEAWLSDVPGLVRLFRIGWHLSCRLPHQAAHRVTQVVTSDEARLQLAERSWLASEIEALVGDSRLIKDVRSHKFGDAHDTLSLLGMVFSKPTIRVLCGLIDRPPMLVGDLQAPSSTTPIQLKAISSVTDLHLAERFLTNLNQQFDPDP